jgi:hypothetical protein
MPGRVVWRFTITGGAWPLEMPPFMAGAILPLSLNQSTTCTIHHVLITAGKKEWRAQDLHSSYFDEMRDHNAHVEEHRYSPSVRRLRSKRFRSSWATAFSYRATAASWDRIWSRAVCAAAGGVLGLRPFFASIPSSGGHGPISALRSSLIARLVH